MSSPAAIDVTPPSPAPAAAPPRAGRSEPPVIVQVVQNLDKGGLETVAVDLACHLQARGIRPVLVGLERGGVLEARLRRAGIEYHVLGGIRHRDPRFHWRLAQVFRRARPRAIHTHHYASLVSSLPAAKLVRVPRIVHTEHGYSYLDAEPRHRPVLRWVSRATDAFVLVAHSMEPVYAKIGVSPARMRVILNGVDLGRYVRRETVPALRRRLGLPTGFLVGSAGRFAQEKNYSMLIRAVARLRRQRPDAYLVLAGDGEFRAEYEAVAAEHGVREAVLFLGWRTDIADIVAALDVFALCSWTEMLPMAVLEAMAAEVPVVATAVGDLPEVLREGETGFLIPPGDEDAMAERLARLASDDGARRRLGVAARASLANRYDHESMVEQYVREYDV